MTTHYYDINEKYLCTSEHNDSAVSVGDFIHIPIGNLPDDKKDFKYLKVKLILHNHAPQKALRYIYGTVVNFEAIKNLLKEAAMD